MAPAIWMLYCALFIKALLCVGLEEQLQLSSLLPLPHILKYPDIYLYLEAAKKQYRNVWSMVSILVETPWPGSCFPAGKSGYQPHCVLKTGANNTCKWWKVDLLVFNFQLKNDSYFSLYLQLRNWGVFLSNEVCRFLNNQKHVIEGNYLFQA